MQGDVCCVLGPGVSSTETGNRVESKLGSELVRADGRVHFRRKYIFGISGPQRFFLRLPSLSPLWENVRVIEDHNALIYAWQSVPEWASHQNLSG